MDKKTSPYIIFNGDLKLHDEFTSPIYSSRAAKYGDSFFETIKLFKGLPLNFYLHFQRIVKTAKLLKYDLPEMWDESFFEALIAKMLRANEVEYGKINIIFSRDTNGLYMPNDKVFNLFMSVMEEKHSLQAYTLNEIGLKLGEYRELIKNSNFTSTLKTGNALTYVLAAIYAKNNKYDECLLFNENGRVAECISSNIILIKNEALISPPIAEYGLDGVMKKVVFQKAEAYGYITQHYPIFAEDLFNASEIILTNSVQGIQWVGNYRGKSYLCPIAKNLLSILNKV